MNSQNQNQTPRTSEETNNQTTSSTTPTNSTNERSTTPNTTPETPERSEELNTEELKETSGGILGLGDDNSSVTTILQGGVGLSHTDEDGNTESTNLDFGTGSLLNTSND